MRRLKVILKWIVLVLFVLIAVAALTVTVRQNLKFDAPYPDVKASADSSVIARGRHLVFSSAHCINCHSKNNPDSLINLGLDVPLTGEYYLICRWEKFIQKTLRRTKKRGS